MTKLLIDAITFGGEVDMLRARLEVLPADLFVVVESNRRYAGGEKPYTFLDNLEVFRDWLPLIHYVQIDGFNSSDAWQNDYHQRRMVGETLDSMGLADTDMVCLFDTDEFWDIRLLEAGLHAWEMPKYHMSLYWYHFDELTGVSGLWKHFRGQDVDRMRWARPAYPKIRGGFHLTSMGDLDYLITKVKGFAHQEYNTPGLEDRLASCWTNGHNLEGVRFTELNDLSHLPDWFELRDLPEEWYRRRPNAL
jgi:hypothetical protein